MTLPPTSSPHAVVSALHPVLAARVTALCARFPGLGVYSGVRTRAAQAALWTGHEKGWPGYNSAAHPDQVNTPQWGLDERTGSDHMIQEDGRGYAADVNYTPMVAAGMDPDEFTAACDELLLVQNVDGEPWHLTMSTHDWWTLPEGSDDMTPAQADRMLTLLQSISDQLNAVDRNTQAVAAQTAPDRLEHILRDIAGKVPWTATT